MLYPPHEDPADRIPVIVGIDVSTKAIALGIVPVLGSLTDVGSLQFAIESKKQNERCAEAFYKTESLLNIIHDSVDVTSVAIESPVGFGGKLLPIVGAVTAACGAQTEWYGPTTWQKIIRNTYELPDGERMKDRVHAAVAANIPEMSKLWNSSTEDQRDSICIALAHRIETLQAIELTDRDLEWLQENG
jgi:hypothetical protein